MKRLIAGLAAALLLPACGGGSGNSKSAEPDPAATPAGASPGVAPANPGAGQPPVVRLIRPETGTSVPEGSMITLEAVLGDPTADIARIEFYDDNQLIGTASSPPYTISYGPLKAGTHQLCAAAVGADGVTVSSIPVTLFVVKGP